MKIEIVSDALYRFVGIDAYNVRLSYHDGDKVMHFRDITVGCLYDIKNGQCVVYAGETAKSKIVALCGVL